MLQKAWDLPLIRLAHRPRPSAIRLVLQQMGDRINLVVPLKTISPLQVFYTDYTELPFDRGRTRVVAPCPAPRRRPRFL